MTAGDFNNDGNDDAILLSELEGRTPAVTVFLSDGKSRPQRRSTTASVFAPFICVGDFNNDGRQDALLYAESQYQMMLGNGDGTFQALPSQSLPISYQVATGDLNHDGNLDFVVLNGQTVYIVLGKGDGTFGAPMPVMSGLNGTAIALADLTGDANLDLAVNGTGANGLSVLPGNGDGTFKSPVYSSSNNFLTMKSGDLNGDGYPDLAGIVAPVQNETSIGVLINNGDGTFRPEVDYFGANGYAPLAIADFNQDGKLDLATEVGESAILLLNKGDGTFPTLQQYAFDGGYDLAVGDFNQDGILDLASDVGAQYESRVVFLLSTGLQ
jgi:hypothetical protein